MSMSGGSGINVINQVANYDNVFRENGNCMAQNGYCGAGDDGFNENKDKLWYRKLKKALVVIQDDLYQKTIKVDAIRRDISSMKSRSSKLILKEVDSKLMNLKSQLSNFTSFFNQMNELEVKYEAIVYDIDRDKSPNKANTSYESVNYQSNSFKKHQAITSSTPNVNNAVACSSPASFPSTPLCDDSDSSPLRRNTSFEEGLQAAVIKTPIKDISDLHGYASRGPNTSSDSPSRYKITPRKSVPRRRMISQEMSSPSQYLLEPPSESGSSMVDDFLSEDLHVKEDVIFGELINHPVLHEKLAQTINKVFNGENIPLEEMNDLMFDSVDQTEQVVDPMVSSPDVTTVEEANAIEANEIQLSDTAIQDILKSMENESVLEDLINICSSKNNILSNGHGSQFSTPSKPLNTPKSNENDFKTPSSKSYISSNVVKNLMNDLKTPEKKQSSVPSSPLSAAINSTINDSHFNISQSSDLMPTLDISTLPNTQPIEVDKLSNMITTSSQNGNVTYTYVLTANEAQDIGLTLPSLSRKALPKSTYRNKRINVDRIEKSNLQGLKRKLNRMEVPALRTIAPFRKIAPKKPTRLEQITTSITSNHPPYSQRIASKSNVRVNLEKKFEKSSNSPPTPVIDAELLKSMNVDQFLSRVHDA